VLTRARRSLHTPRVVKGALKIRNPYNENKKGSCYRRLEPQSRHPPSLNNMFGSVSV
jgi:hypothetical protein